jgi:hypothetical protein
MAENKSPSFNFYSSDFITGTFFMNYTQRGKYITLLCLQHQQGHLSEDDMLSVCGEYDKKIFEKFIQDENGLYYNKRLETEVIKKKAYCESRSNNRKSKNICNSYDEHMEIEIEIEKEINNINTKLDIDNTKSNYDDIFNLFWNAYPKKIGKAYAKKCFEKLKPNAELVDKMVSAINVQKQTDSWKEAKGKFIPNPSTWLNQQRWDDVVEVETVQPKYKNIGVIL